VECYQTQNHLVCDHLYPRFQAWRFVAASLRAVVVAVAAAVVAAAAVAAVVGLVCFLNLAIVDTADFLTDFVIPPKSPQQSFVPPKM
jgi:hypothetical protein